MYACCMFKCLYVYTWTRTHTHICGYWKAKVLNWLNLRNHSRHVGVVYDISNELVSGHRVFRLCVCASVWMCVFSYMCVCSCVHISDVGQAANDADGPICCLIRWWALRVPPYSHICPHTYTHRQCYQARHKVSCRGFSIFSIQRLFTSPQVVGLQPSQWEKATYCLLHCLYVIVCF